MQILNFEWGIDEHPLSHCDLKLIHVRLLTEASDKNENLEHAALMLTTCDALLVVERQSFKLSMIGILTSFCRFSIQYGRSPRGHIVMQCLVLLRIRSCLISFISTEHLLWMRIVFTGHLSRSGMERSVMSFQVNIAYTIILLRKM